MTIDRGMAASSNVLATLANSLVQHCPGELGFACLFAIARQAQHIGQWNFRVQLAAEKKLTGTSPCFQWRFEADS